MSKRQDAARIYAKTNNVSETARQVGVHRSTIIRWMKDPGFLEGNRETPRSPTQLEKLVPKAMQLLSDALDGEKVTVSQIRAAMEVVRATNALKAEQTKVGSTLESRLAELDRRRTRSD
jgi:transposase-like protein